MINKIEFGKKINYRPLTLSLIISFFAGTLGLTVNIKISIISFFVVLFLLLCIYYPLNLKRLFGHWQLEKYGISYYKMNTYRDKLKIILFPNNTDFQFISYSQIKDFQIIESDNRYSITDLLTINPAKQSLILWNRKPFYLELELNNSNVNLDLSYDQLHDSKNTMFRLANALNIINKKIN